MCGLGRFLASTGRLNADTIPLALASIGRFRTLADICGVRHRDLHPFATAAVRWADDGPAFLARAEEACGAPIRVIDNDGEAELAATGIMAGFQNPSGIVGDLGGGSLELVRLAGGQYQEMVSLPIGGLALIDKTKGEKSAAVPLIENALADAGWITRGRGEPFYAIGGTWRALAKVSMRQAAYPLTAIHGYRLETRKAQQITARYANLPPAALSRLEALPAGREETLPYGALVLNALVRNIGPAAVVFSAFGVREGLLYGLMSESERQKDPLLSACEDMARLRSRSPAHAQELIAWTDTVFSASGLDENNEARRLRHAACFLSDVAWRAHPDYRGEQSAVFIAQSALVGIDHPGRAFLALCVYHRYERQLQGDLLVRMAKLISRAERKRALVLGQLVRLAHTLSAGMAGVLPQTELRYEGGKLLLHMAYRLGPLDGDALRRRLRMLGKDFGATPEVVIAQPARSLFRPS